MLEFCTTQNSIKFSAYVGEQVLALNCLKLFESLILKGYTKQALI